MQNGGVDIDVVGFLVLLAPLGGKSVNADDVTDLRKKRPENVVIKAERLGYAAALSADLPEAFKALQAIYNLKILINLEIMHQVSAVLALSPHSRRKTNVARAESKHSRTTCR